MPSPRRPLAALLTAACLTVAATGLSACGGDDAKKAGTVSNDNGNPNAPGTPSDRSGGGSNSSDRGGGSTNSGGGVGSGGGNDGTNENPQVPTTVYSPGTTVASGQPNTGAG